MVCSGLQILYLCFFSDIDNHLFPADVCSHGVHKDMYFSADADGWFIKVSFTNFIVVPIALCIPRYMCIMHAHYVLLGLLLSSCSWYSVAWLRLLSDYIEQLKPLHMTGLNVKWAPIHCALQSFSLCPSCKGCDQCANCYLNGIIVFLRPRSCL